MSERSVFMKNKLLKAIFTFVGVMIFGMVYVAVFGDNLSAFSFKENSGLIHAILFSTASICTTIVVLSRKE